MNRRQFLQMSALGMGSLTLPSILPGMQSDGRKPNILFIMADDLDKEWISCYGSESIETPNIDALAAGGMQFDNAYCMPQCTPTRVTLLTGQYPFRHGWIYHWDVPRWGAGCHFDWKHNMTFARVMQTAGYVTGIAGKWQINDFRVQPDALIQHGFDDYCMWTGGEGGNPVSDERYWDPYIHTKDGSRTYKGEYGPDIFTDFLIHFMEKHSNEPMMLYYPMVLPHGPLVTTPLEPDVSENIDKHTAMVHYIDYLVGKLVKALEELGIRENTIIIFTTDNGTSGGITGRRNGRDVRGGKSYTTENGVNVPFIVNGPGLVPAGVRTDTLTDFTDLLPTFAGLGGATIPDDLVVDGFSINDLLLGKARDSARQWILAMGSHRGALSEEGRVVPVLDYRDRVIRDKQFKLYVGRDRKSKALFDLLADPDEEHNLIESTYPAVTAARQKLESVVQALPKQDAAPRYDPLAPQPWDVKPEGDWLVENSRERFINRKPDWKMR
jgi:arylsulfatase A-like enzyme